MKANPKITALPPTTKYSCNNNSSVFVLLLGSYGRKLSSAAEGRKVVSEKATLASIAENYEPSPLSFDALNLGCRSHCFFF